MVFLRSLLFQFFFIAWTVFVGVTGLPVSLVMSRRSAQKIARIWVEGTLLLQRVLPGITFVIEGGPVTENVIYAVKHQSAWETMVFHSLVSDPVFILKQELLGIPLIGWYLRRTGQIAIDRKAGIRSLRKVVDQARIALEEGRTVVIFPEGHRQPPGTGGTYHASVAMIQAAAGCRVIPVALNSGLFWGRNSFLRYPGQITMRLLPAMPFEPDRRIFMARLRDNIEEATRELELQVIRARQHPPAANHDFPCPGPGQSDHV